MDAQTLPSQVNILVVQGEGAINHVRQSAKDPIILVEDEHHTPIAGATVLFSLPTEGTTGRFGNGDKLMVVTTDAQGHATATGLKVNEYPGKLVIHVGVTYRGLSARTDITEFDEGPPVAQKAGGGGGGGGGHKKLIAILVIVGGAAAAGAAYYLTHKSGNSSTSTVVTPPPAAIGLTPGSPTITGPH